MFSGAKDACVHKRVANAAKRLFCILFAHATVQPHAMFSPQHHAHVRSSACHLAAVYHALCVHTPYCPTA